MDMKVDPVDVHGTFSHADAMVQLQPGGSIVLETPHQTSTLDRVQIPGHLIEVGLHATMHLRSHAGGYGFMSSGNGALSWPGLG